MFISYFDNALIWSNQHEQTVSIRLGLAMKAINIIKSIFEQNIVTWKQLILSRFSSGATLNPPFADMNEAHNNDTFAFLQHFLFRPLALLANPAV